MPNVHCYIRLLGSHVTFISEAKQKHDNMIYGIADVYRSLQEGTSEGTMFTIAATIIGVDLSNDWNYKLAVRVLDEHEEMTCVLLDDDVVALLDITANELISKSLMEIDKYNLAPHYVRRFTVSKYVGENTQLLAIENVSSTTSTSIPITDHDASCIMEEEDKFFSRITTDEWEMADKALWATCYPNVSSVVSTSSSAIVPNEAGINIVSSTQDLHSEDATTSILLSVESNKDQQKANIRPKKTTHKPKCFMCD
ncbi:hypothetical protein R6Q57_017270 [Mikania cordata]